MYKNNEGYADPTAGKAINNIHRKQNEKKELAVKLANALFDALGFEPVTNIVLREKKGFIK